MKQCGRRSCKSPVPKLTQPNIPPPIAQLSSFGRDAAQSDPWDGGAAAGAERPGLPPGAGHIQLQRSAALTLSRTGLAGFFAFEVFAEDVLRGKPDPQPYQIALDRLAINSHEAVAFENSQAGIESAAAAGLRVFALRHRYNADQDFLKHLLCWIH